MRQLRLTLYSNDASVPFHILRQTWEISFFLVPIINCLVCLVLPKVGLKLLFNWYVYSSPFLKFIIKLCFQSHVLVGKTSHKPHQNDADFHRLLYHWLLCGWIEMLINAHICWKLRESIFRVKLSLKLLSRCILAK